MKQLLARRPQLALPFSILPQPDEVILVAGEDFRYRFTAPGLGGWLPSFLARLDGSLSVQELLGGLEEAQRDAALQVLERLIGERAAIEGSARSAHVPQVARVAVEGSGELRELLANGLNCDEPTLVVLAQDRLDYAAALACNRRCRQQGLPWLWASTGAMQRGYVSPLFLPDAGPCFACLLRSFQQLSPVPDLYDALIAHSRNQGALVPGPFAPTALRILEQLLRWKVEQASAAEAPAALYRLHVLECATMELAAHRVFVDSECPECRGGRP